jgi:hypothetical protein
MIIDGDSMQPILFGVATLICVLAANSAYARTVHFTAMLKGANVVPPNATAGEGLVAATLDREAKTFSYTVTYSGLPERAIAAHFHGPAVRGEIAPPVIRLVTLQSPIRGTARLTKQQIVDLIAGRWYFDLHTETHLTGEIRGQLGKTR